MVLSTKLVVSFYWGSVALKNRDSMSASVSTLAPPKQGFFFSRGGLSAAAVGGARFLGSSAGGAGRARRAGTGVTAGSEPGTGRVRRRRPAAGSHSLKKVSESTPLKNFARRF